MRIYRSLDEVPDGFGPSAVTIGKFDGVHLGHQTLIDRLLAEADARSLTSVIVTFDRNPLSLIAPKACPAPLVSLDQKLELLAGTGVDTTVQLTFDHALQSKTPEEFVADILSDALDARLVLVGEDFRFGHKGRGDVDLLRTLGFVHGFDVLTIDDVMPLGRRRVSSTWIRDLLAEGDVVEATALLGHPPTVSGVVVHGAKRGRELGFPTANLSPESQGLIPADGVYAGRLIVDGTVYPAAISVGNNPTFDGVPQKQVEAFVLDEDLDLYDRVVDIQFVDRIRGMVAFTGVGPLIEQMHRDVERVREILA